MFVTGILAGAPLLIFTLFADASSRRVNLELLDVLLVVQLQLLQQILAHVVECRNRLPLFGAIPVDSVLQFKFLCHLVHAREHIRMSS